jgi:hypothetical protein
MNIFKIFNKKSFPIKINTRSEPKQVKAFIRFREPVEELKNNPRTLWMSKDMTCLIAMFDREDFWYRSIKIATGTDIAKESEIISSEEQEEKLKIEV